LLGKNKYHKEKYKKEIWNRKRLWKG